MEVHIYCTFCICSLSWVSDLMTFCLHHFCGAMWVSSSDRLFNQTSTAKRGRHLRIAYSSLASTLMLESFHLLPLLTIFSLYPSIVWVVNIAGLRSRATMTQKLSRQVRENKQILRLFFVTDCIFVLSLLVTFIYPRF